MSISAVLLRSVPWLMTICDVFLFRWTTSRGPARLRQLEDDLSRKEAELKDTRDAINSYEGLIRLAENDVHQSDKNKKNIQDNIRQRAFKSQVENAQREMSELNVEEATIAREQYEHRYGKSRQKETDLNAQVRASLSFTSVLSIV